MNIESLREQSEQVSNQARALLANVKAQCEAQGGRAMTAAESESVQTLIDKGKSIKTRLDTARSNLTMSAEIERLTGGMTTSSSQHNGVPSLGQQFVSDPRFQDFIKRGEHRMSGGWNSPAVELMAATLTEDSASGGALVLPHHLPGIVETPTRELTVADLFNGGQTDSNMISFMREVSFLNAAAAVAEGGTKPQSTLTFEAATSPTVKLAHWIETTTEVLEDSSLVASYVNRRLLHGLELVVDDNLVNGSGVAPNLQGILAKTGLATSIPRGTMTNSDAIAAQIAAIETGTLLKVDAIIMHPSNWLAIQTAKTTTGEYLSGSGPIGSAAPQMLWGRRVAVTPVIALGTALVGSFRSAAQLFYRGGYILRASSSHANFFIENKVALLGEVRVNLVTFRNAAFGTVTGLTA